MVKVARPTDTEIGSTSYLPNGKAYEIQTWYTDGARRPALAARHELQGQRSRSQGHVMRLTGVSRTKSPTPKLVGMLPMRCHGQ